MRQTLNNLGLLLTGFGQRYSLVMLIGSRPSAEAWASRSGDSVLPSCSWVDIAAAAIGRRKDRPTAGTVFEAADGTFFVFSSARTRKQADHLAASIPSSTVVEARPSFSFPAKDWVARDPQFWQANARQGPLGDNGQFALR